MNAIREKLFCYEADKDISIANMFHSKAIASDEKGCFYATNRRFRYMFLAFEYTVRAHLFLARIITEKKG